MARIVTHHGYSFGLDTADWGSNSASGEKAGAYLAEWLRSLDADKTRDLHAALSDPDNTDHPLVQEAIDAGNRAALRVMKEEAWASTPDTGHNCDLFAA